MSRAILYTRHEGGVSICYPAEEAMLWMQTGGQWADRPRGFREEQVRRQIEAGILPDHALRYANAVTFGGCTRAEAFDIIKDRDCTQHGHSFDVIETTVDLPPDRWFRDAWHRSANGGPVVIDLAKARLIHWARLDKAVEDENKRRHKAFEAEREILFDPDKYRTAIKHARDEEELKRIWVPELSSPP